MENSFRNPRTLNSEPVASNYIISSVPRVPLVTRKHPVVEDRLHVEFQGVCYSFWS